MNLASQRVRWVLRGSAVLALGVFLGLSWLALADSTGAKDATYQRIYAQVVPAVGTETSYGIPLALANLPQFIAWRDSITLTSAESQVFHDALVQVPAPCCDDGTTFQCCCEKAGQRCNIVTSAKGLAAYLIHTKAYTVEQARDAVVQWLTFTRPDYYVAKALQTEGIDPSVYELTTRGSCYRGMCEVSISEGGCGGMGTLIEPAIQGTKS